MPNDYDVIVAGLGAMGSAAAFHLAASGRRVLGLDRFQPPHTLWSSHGLTRIIREAYFEHPLYVPLVQRSSELHRRFPVFEPAENLIAVWEPRAGILFPELAVESHLKLAAENGAVLQF